MCQSQVLRTDRRMAKVILHLTDFVHSHRKAIRSSSTTCVPNLKEVFGGSRNRKTHASTCPFNAAQGLKATTSASNNHGTSPVLQAFHCLLTSPPISTTRHEADGPPVLQTILVFVSDAIGMSATRYWRLLILIQVSPHAEHVFRLSISKRVIAKVKLRD